MNILKEATIESIKRMPDACTVEDIMYQVNFIAQVLEGLEDARTGRTLTTEEVLKRVEQWSK